MITSRSTHRPAPDGLDYSTASLYALIAITAAMAGPGVNLITAGADLNREELRALVLVNTGCTCLAMMLLTQVLASLNAWWFWTRGVR